MFSKMWLYQHLIAIDELTTIVDFIKCDIKHGIKEVYWYYALSFFQ
jgi:hypothetical protein